MGMREEFEAWMIETAERFHPDFTRRGIDGEYQNVGIEHDWVVWQASRTVAVITLPADDPLGSGPGDCEGGLPSFEQHCAAECNFILQDCRDAIRAAGITINTTTVSGSN